MSSNFFKRLFVRNLEVENLFESFFISAVGAILILRFLLYLLRYPQLGVRSLHISHMLWGGLLMLLAQIILFSFITKLAQRTAAVIGGTGFGIFIDELGKFITRDNNYFFQPTIALLYVIFILLFFAFRKLGRIRSANKTEYFINALEISKEVILNDLDKEEKNKALFFLEKSGQKDSFTREFTKMFTEENLVPLKPNPISRFTHRVRNFYLDITARSWFVKSLAYLFIFQCLVLITNAILVGNSFRLQPLNLTSLPQKLEIFSSIVSTGLVVIGIIKLQRKRLEAYFDFKKSLLISIFLTQVFAFYDLQLVAIIELGFNVALLIAVNQIVKLEKIKI